jgi:hypothetical protein
VSGDGLATATELEVRLFNSVAQCLPSLSALNLIPILSLLTGMDDSIIIWSNIKIIYHTPHDREMACPRTASRALRVAAVVSALLPVRVALAATLFPRHVPRPSYMKQPHLLCVVHAVDQDDGDDGYAHNGYTEACNEGDLVRRD